ncbi:MAG: hypothetical protein LBQ70_04250 [Prevotellaceae bacterium]|jgi:hypothetical protein|nr:hypothetical protein [Prevotellaceae bacterium]
MKITNEILDEVLRFLEKQDDETTLNGMGKKFSESDTLRIKEQLKDYIFTSNKWTYGDNVFFRLNNIGFEFIKQGGFAKQAKRKTNEDRRLTRELEYYTVFKVFSIAALTVSIISLLFALGVFKQ